MNDLTGAFLAARSRGENVLFTRQSLANAGYSVQEIEEAFMEANQILQSRIAPQVKPIEKKSYKKLFWILTIIAVLILSGVAFWIYLTNILGDSYVSSLG